MKECERDFRQKSVEWEEGRHPGENIRSFFELIAFGDVVPSFDSFQNSISFHVACTLWLLDYFAGEAWEKRKQFLSILPKNTPDLHDKGYPDIHDIRSSELLVNKVLCAVANLDGKSKGAMQKIIDLIDEKTKETLRGFLLCTVDHLVNVGISIGESNASLFFREASAVFSDSSYRKNHPDVPLRLFREMRRCIEGNPFDLSMALYLLSWEKHPVMGLHDAISAVVSAIRPSIPDYEQRTTSFASSVKGIPQGERLYGDGLYTYEQMVFLTTGIILSRGRTISPDIVDAALRLGASEDVARQTAELALVYGELEKRASDNLKLHFDLLTAGDESASSDDPEIAGSVRTIKEALKTKEQYDGANQLSLRKDRQNSDALEVRLKEAQRMLESLEKEKQTLQQESEQNRLMQEANNKELYELRELFFTLDGPEEAENLEEVITFPYDCSKKIVVFGGHASWRKNIRPLLPRVHFYDQETLPSSDLIKNADLLFFETSAMSHSFFYAVTDDAKRFAVPYHYLGSLSAQAAARKIVFYDKGELHA